MKTKLSSLAQAKHELIILIVIAGLAASHSFGQNAKGVNWFTVGVIVVAAAVFWRKQAPNACFDSKKNPTTEESEE